MHMCWVFSIQGVECPALLQVADIAGAARTPPQAHSSTGCSLDKRSWAEWCVAGRSKRVSFQKAEGKAGDSAKRTREAPTSSSKPERSGPSVGREASRFSHPSARLASSHPTGSFDLVRLPGGSREGLRFIRPQEAFQKMHGIRDRHVRPLTQRHVWRHLR